jgi:hypothetical protein
MTFRSGLSAVSFALAVTVAAPAWAQSAPPPPLPNAEVYAGPCTVPAMKRGPEQQSFIGSLFAAVAPGLIDKGLDALGAALQKLAADKQTTLSGQVATERAYSNRYCLQIVRFGSMRADPKAKGPPPADLAAGAVFPEAMLGRMRAAGIRTDIAPEFFLELWVRPSVDGSAASLTPTALYYPRSLGGTAADSRDGVVTVSFAISPPAAAAAPRTFALGRLAPRPELKLFLPTTAAQANGLSDADLRTICQNGCEAASPWYPNPFAGLVDPSAGGGQGQGQGGGAQPGLNPEFAGGPAAPGITYRKAPLNASLTVTEIREGSKFFKFAAELWTAARPTVETELNQLALADKRTQAKAAETQAQVQALNAYAQAVNAVAPVRQQYCAATTPNAILAASATLRGVQLAANVAAAGADQPAPFAPPVAVSATKDAGQCG